MPHSGTRLLGPEVLLALQRGSGRSLHEQLEEGLRAAIQSGALPRGLVLPSTRMLASDLGVSRRLVLEAYCTRFTQAERFSGILVLALGRTIARTELGFAQMNEALKTRSESG